MLYSFGRVRATLLRRSNSICYFKAPSNMLQLIATGSPNVCDMLCTLCCVRLASAFTTSRNMIQPCVKMLRAFRVLYLGLEYLFQISILLRATLTLTLRILHFYSQQKKMSVRTNWSEKISVLNVEFMVHNTCHVMKHISQ